MSEESKSKVDWANKEKLDEKTISKLAKDLYNGSKIASWTVEPSMQHMVFLPIMLSEDLDFEEMQKHGWYLFIGDVDSQLGRAVNGYPMVSKVLIVHKEDAEKIHSKVMEIQSLMDDV